MKGYEQRREDIMSCRSDNLHTLMTFQGQESRGGVKLQGSLYELIISDDGRIVFSTKLKPPS